MFEEAITKRREDLIKAVLECVKINSVRSSAEAGMPFGPGPHRALQHILNRAENGGFTTKNVDNVIGYAEYGQGQEMIAVLGHLDIVPIGEGWNYDPFGEIAEGRIYGRGTLDDKGPCIGALFALEAIKESGLKLNRRIRLIFGTNEETGGEDVKRYNLTEETPVMGFTPDADYPVIFCEKGLARFTISREFDQMGSGVVLKCAKGGTAPNLVPDQAEGLLVYQDKREELVTFQGTSAHGSTPEKGVNAVSKLMEYLATCDLEEKLMDFVGFYNKFIGNETDGTSLGIRYHHEKFGDSTLNPGLLCCDGKKIEITFDYRYPYGETVEKAFKRIEQQAELYGLNMDVTRNVKPLYMPEDSPLVQTLQRVYEQQTGEKQAPIVIGGGTYAKTMKNIVAFGPIFPGQENIIHQKDEYISIKHLVQNTVIMANAMYELAK